VDDGLLVGTQAGDCRAEQGG